MDEPSHEKGLQGPVQDIEKGRDAIFATFSRPPKGGKNAAPQRIQRGHKRNRPLNDTGFGSVAISEAPHRLGIMACSSICCSSAFKSVMAA